MSKGWEVKGSYGYRPFPGKGFGVVYILRSREYLWKVQLDTGRNDYACLGQGYATSFEEAKRIVDEMFDLIEPLEV